MPCCTRRREDGIIDRVEIANAEAGRAARLSPTEARMVMWRLSQTKKWGLRQISSHIGYSASQVAAILAEQQKRGRA